MSQFGRILLEEQIINDEQLSIALERQKREGGRLGQNLSALGFVTEQDIRRVFNKIPHIPETVAESGLDRSFINDLILKHLLSMSEFRIQDVVERIKLPIPIIESGLEDLRNDKLIEIKGASSYNKLAYVFKLTELGIKRGGELLQLCRYVGPAPVTLPEYCKMVRVQTVKSVIINDKTLRNSLSHLVINERVLGSIGPAFSSGQAVFIYGPPGNGKSAIAEAVGKVFPDSIYIPYSIIVGGQIINVFDPVNHIPIEEPKGQGDFDTRWILIKRPVIMAGGELTLKMLDLDFNPISKYYEASLQMKANNGLFVVDDFGRQLVEPSRILNRWIVPLERRVDFMSLHTGMKFTIPFDMLIIFATNIEPKQLVDEAFLRRIRYKVRIDRPTPKEYEQIFRMVCESHGIQFNQEVFIYLIEQCYQRFGVELSASHPRDLIDHIVVDSHYFNRPPELSRQNIDKACSNYFVDL